MLELTQQQIQVKNQISRWKMFIKFLLQDAEKQKQNLLSSPNQINLNKMVLTDQTTPSTPGKSQKKIFLSPFCFRFRYSGTSFRRRKNEWSWNFSRR
jgi:hypothetical protein